MILTIERVSVTALADVILTGCVTEMVADKQTDNTCTVTIQAHSADAAMRLMRALTRPHDPSRIIRPSDLPDA